MRSKLVSFKRRLKQLERKRGKHREPGCGVFVIDDKDWKDTGANYQSSRPKGFLVMPQGKDEETWVEQAREYYEWAEQIQRKFMEGEDLDTILG